jgi:hypothetical protein
MLLTPKSATHFAEKQTKNNPVIQQPVSIKLILKVTFHLIVGHGRSRFPRAFRDKILRVILVPPFEFQYIVTPVMELI